MVHSDKKYLEISWSSACQLQWSASNYYKQGDTLGYGMTEIFYMYQLVQCPLQAKPHIGLLVKDFEVCALVSAGPVIC